MTGFSVIRILPDRLRDDGMKGLDHQQDTLPGKMIFDALAENLER